MGTCLIANDVFIVVIIFLLVFAVFYSSISLNAEVPEDLQLLSQFKKQT